jgi:hypothetical protein
MELLFTRAGNAFCLNPADFTKGEADVLQWVKSKRSLG